jgi:hypothetical protein
MIWTKSWYGQTVEQIYKGVTIRTRATLLQNTPVSKAFDRDVGIIDMHMRYALGNIRKYMDILSFPKTLTLQILT